MMIPCRDYEDLVRLTESNTIFLEGPAQLGKSHLAERLSITHDRRVYTTFATMVVPEHRVGPWRKNIANMFGFSDNLWEGGLYALDAFAQLEQLTIIDRCYLSNVVYQGNKRQLPLFTELYKRVHGVIVLVIPEDRFAWERRYNRLDVSSEVDLFPQWYAERLDQVYDYRTVADAFRPIIYYGET